MRRQNEDRFLRDETLRAFGVADGVGGLPGGAKAAEAAVEGITKALARHRPQRAAQLVPLVLHVNEAVNDLGTDISPGVGIATTLTFGICTAEELLLAHVGDSRCYLWRRGRFTMLTEDHSVENEARHRRARGEFAGYADRYRNALTRCIGQPTHPEVDVSAHDLAVGDLYLFATDGITRVLGDHEIAEVVGGKGTLDERLAELIDRANQRGGPDNATAVLVSVEAR
ncbi:MAG TPA: PP2C family serine/threonine-protein phosphatase [Myxococcota bacterium]|nr:PP2C family serine/threonine-protein phosphatase [Myxococcota bacterium]